ncbi:WD40 repeat domain-containing protein [Herbidospora sp. RD11066]
MVTKLPPGVHRIGETPGVLRQNTFVGCLAISADGRTVVTGDEKGVVRVFDVVTGRCREHKPPAEVRRGRAIQDVAVSGDGRVFAARHYAGIRLPGMVIPDIGHSGLAFAGHTLVGANVRAVSVADTASGAIREIRAGGGAAARCLAVRDVRAGGGGLIAVAFQDRRVRLFDAATGAVRAAADLGPDDDLAWSDLAFAPDGGILLCLGLTLLTMWTERGMPLTRRTLDVPDADPYASPACSRRSARWPCIRSGTRLCWSI